MRNSHSIDDADIGLIEFLCTMKPAAWQPADILINVQSLLRIALLYYARIIQSKTPDTTDTVFISASFLMAQIICPDACDSDSEFHLILQLLSHTGS